MTDHPDKTNLAIVHDFIVGLGAVKDMDCHTELVGWIEADRAVKELVTEQADRAGGDGLLPISEEERHAIAHARYQVSQASIVNPDCCFDYDLVKDLLRVIDRSRDALPSGNAGERAEPIAWAWKHKSHPDLPWSISLTPLTGCLDLIIVQPLAPPQPAPDALREALTDARDTISRLPEDTFGFGNYNDESQWWPIRDELLAKISTALSSAPVPSGEGSDVLSEGGK